MTNQDRILATLAREEAPICDDCLSARAGIAPRQTVNQICSALGFLNAIRRAQRQCGSCGKLKKTSQTPRERDATNSPAALSLSSAEKGAAISDRLPEGRPEAARATPAIADVGRRAPPDRAWH
jgi:hypothetical protein